MTSTAIVAALAAPGLAAATSLWHPANGEVGFTEHPDHLQATKTRAQVIAELESARKDGTLFLIQRSLPIPAKNASPGKTRQQVIAEMRNESPAERNVRVALLGGG